MFGKLVDNNIKYFSGSFIIVTRTESSVVLDEDGVTEREVNINKDYIISNPQDDELINAGYKYIVDNGVEKIEENQYFERTYVESDDTITVEYSIFDKEIIEDEDIANIPDGYHQEVIREDDGKTIYIRKMLVEDYVEPIEEVAIENNDGISNETINEVTEGYLPLGL